MDLQIPSRGTLIGSWLASMFIATLLLQAQNPALAAKGSWPLIARALWLVRQHPPQPFKLHLDL
ncbi:MAG: hypothetical protein RLZZ613_509 [Pseudomonadota bacterium]